MSVPVATLARAWVGDLPVAHAERDVAQLDTLSTTLQKTAEVRRFLSDPRRTIEQKVAAVAGAGFSRGATSMVRWLVAGRRLHDLPALVRSARRIVERMGGSAAASVVSAVPLEAAERRSLVSKLKQLAGGDVTLEERVDAGILGGLVVTLGGRRRDLSLRSRIDGLRRAVAA